MRQTIAELPSRNLPRNGAFVQARPVNPHVGLKPLIVQGVVKHKASGAALRERPVLLVGLRIGHAVVVEFVAMAAALMVGLNAVGLDSPAVKHVEAHHETAAQEAIEGVPVGVRLGVREGVRVIFVVDGAPGADHIRRPVKILHVRVVGNVAAPSLIMAVDLRGVIHDSGIRGGSNVIEEDAGCLVRIARHVAHGVVRNPRVRGTVDGDEGGIVHIGVERQSLNGDVVRGINREAPATTIRNRDAARSRRRGTRPRGGPADGQMVAAGDIDLRGPCRRARRDVDGIAVRRAIDAALQAGTVRRRGPGRA